MLYYMNSRVFSKLFLNHESDKDILNCQYILISNRIRAGAERNNVISYGSLYPKSEVLLQRNPDSFREAYYNQLKIYRSVIAILIRGSIKKKYNIIFLCTPKESKVGYIEMFADYVYEKFGYPVYNYEDYVKCKCDLVEFDTKKVLDKCSKYIKSNKYKKLSDDQLVHLIRKKPHKIEKMLKKEYNYEIDLEDVEEEELFYIVNHIREFFNR